MIARRVDLAAGVMLIERHPRNVLIDLPRGRLPVASVAELNDVIAELMAVREDWIEEPAAFVNRGTGHA